jgi:putative sigma-54 modulation protein
MSDLLGGSGIEVLWKEIPVIIKIAARHGHLGEASQAKITAKLEKMSRVFERLTAIEATVNLEHKDSTSIDLRVSAEHKHDFVATAEADDMMAALDGVIHKIEEQLRRYKQRVQEHRGPGLRQSAIVPEPESAG